MKWGKLCCVTFYDFVEFLFQIYYVSKGNLKTANKQYNTTSNDYELTLNNETTITPCEEEVDLPTMKFNFVPINQLEQQKEESFIGEVFRLQTKEHVVDIPLYIIIWFLKQMPDSGSLLRASQH